MNGYVSSQLMPLLAVNDFATFIDKLARTPLSIIVLMSVVLTLIRMGLHAKLKSTEPHQRFGSFKFLKSVDGLCDAIVYAAIVVFMMVRPFVLQTFNIPSGSMIDTLRVGDFIVANKFTYRTADPKRGEVIVFRPPATALYPGQDPETSFIKRLVGTPGDVIEWRGKKMYCNGAVVEEKHADFTVPGNEEGSPAPKELWSQIPQADFKFVEDGGKVIPVLYTNNAVNGMPINNTGTDVNITHGQGSTEPNDLDQAMRWKEAPPAKIPQRMYFFMGDNRNGSLDGRFWGLVPRDSIIGKAEIIWLPTSRWRRIE